MLDLIAWTQPLTDEERTARDYIRHLEIELAEAKAQIAELERELDARGDRGGDESDSNETLGLHLGVQK